MSTAEKMVKTAFPSRGLSLLEPRFSCMLFDVDNTLIDTDSLILQLLRHVSRRMHRLETKQLRSLPPQKILRDLGYPISRTRYRSLYARMAQAATLLAPDAPVVLSELNNHGVKLGVVTSSPRWIVDLLLRYNQFLWIA